MTYTIPPLPGYRPATSWAHYTTGCDTHSLVLLKMGVIIALNTLSCLELLINRYCCIWLVFISRMSMMHFHTNIKLIMSLFSVISALFSCTAGSMYGVSNNMAVGERTEIGKRVSKIGRRMTLILWPSSPNNLHHPNHCKSVRKRAYMLFEIAVSSFGYKSLLFRAQKCSVLVVNCDWARVGN